MQRSAKRPPVCFVLKRGNAPSPLPLVASSRRRRIEGDFSQNIAIALLILSLPNTSAQQITERNLNQDLNTLGLASGNKNPVGLCAVTNSNNNKTYMLVSDRDGKIYTYILETKERQDNHHTDADDFVLPADNRDSTGIWSDDETLWVAEANTLFTNVVTNGNTTTTNTYKKILAYDLEWTDKNGKTNTSLGVLKVAHDNDKEFVLDDVARNKAPIGLWSNGETMWVVDLASKKIYDYNQPLSGNASLKSLSISKVYYNIRLFQSILKAQVPQTFTPKPTRFSQLPQRSPTKRKRRTHS